MVLAHRTNAQPVGPSHRGRRVRRRPAAGRRQLVLTLSFNVETFLGGISFPPQTVGDLTLVFNLSLFL